MIQAIGLTKSYRRGRIQALDDVSFEAPPGRVTVLLGAPGAGKSLVLRLMIGQVRGRGAALFDGRPYQRIRRPEREIGVVLPPAGGLPGHPGRRARNHLRMLAAAAGVPARRADQLLEQTCLAPAASHRLRTFSPGMSRRLMLAAALLGDPHSLLLDEPTAGLSPKNVEWFHAFLRAFAASGGTVLVTCSEPEEAARLADQVLVLERGTLVADQAVADFVRTRLREQVVVQGPQIGRLADLLVDTGAEVHVESGTRILVWGLERTEIGELAYRHGILLHQLADHGLLRRPEAAALPVPAPALPQRAAGTPAAAEQPVDERVDEPADAVPRAALSAARAALPDSEETAGRARTGERPGRSATPSAPGSPGAGPDRPAAALLSTVAGTADGAEAERGARVAQHLTAAAEGAAPRSGAAPGQMLGASRPWEVLAGAGGPPRARSAATADRLREGTGPAVRAAAKGSAETGATAPGDGAVTPGETVIVLRPGGAVTATVRAVPEVLVLDKALPEQAVQPVGAPAAGLPADGARSGPVRSTPAAGGAGPANGLAFRRTDTGAEVDAVPVDAQPGGTAPTGTADTRGPARPDVCARAVPSTVRESAAPAAGRAAAAPVALNAPSPHRPGAKPSAAHARTSAAPAPGAATPRASAATGAPGTAGALPATSVRGASAVSSAGRHGRADCPQRPSAVPLTAHDPRGE